LSIALFACFPWTSARAQEIPEDTLSGPETTFDYGFTGVSGIRELRDGRVIVVDAGLGEVYLVDASGTSVEQIGRSGAGPGEYGQPAQVFALPGDSSAVLDPFRGRLLLLGPNAEFVRFLYNGGCVGCSLSAVGILLNLPEATDGRGNFYTLAQPIARTPDGQLVPTDSAAIERWRVGASTRDTVAFLDTNLPDAGLRVLAGTLVFPPPDRRQPHRAFFTSRQWIISNNGQVAIVYPQPYHVEYMDSGGHVRIGADIPYDRVEVSEDLKQQWLDKQPTSASAATQPPSR